MDVNDNDLTYSVKTRSSVALEQKELLEKEISKNPDFERQLVDILNDEVYEGKTVVAVGYTRVYLKEETTNGTSHLQPMTVSEMESSQKARAGTPAKKGNLTLSTVVAIDNWDRTIASCNGYADWTVGFWDNSTNNPHNSTNDFMTVSQAHNFYLSSETLSGTPTDKSWQLTSYLAY